MDRAEKFFVPVVDDGPARIGNLVQIVTSSLMAQETKPPSLYVLEGEARNNSYLQAGAAPSQGQRRPLIERTVAPANNGLDPKELDRMTGAGHFMLTTGLQIRWFALADALLGLPVADALAARDKFLSRLVRLQKEAGLPQYYIDVRETTGGLHFNIVAVCTRKIAVKLQRLFAAYLLGKDAVCRVDDMDRLLRDYLAKERTTQADYAKRGQLGRRRTGSHKLVCGGDRVRLSEALERDGIAAKKIERWQKTHSRRSETRKPPKVYRLRRKKALDISGQLALLPLKDDTRLRYFHGGHMTAPQAREAEYQRERIGLSQYQLADAIGCSQPHYANVIRGHDPLSRIAAFRLRQVLLGEELAA